jgi:dihydropyrimidine dehydrogenase (NAD+) subunit PreT
VPFAQLEKDFDAIFVGLGLGADSRLGAPGETLGGIVGAVEWIEKMKLGTVDVASVLSAVVIGGGNTAIDCVRELLGLGIPSVTMVYRGDREGMSGYHHEWDAAGVEGAKALWRRQPIEFLGTNGKVERVRCLELDAAKKPIAGSEHAIDADLVLLAIGQAKLGELLGGLDGIALDRGRVVVDEHGCTGRAKYFAGGDCANGGKEVVNAAAEGKRAARAIDRFVRGETHA